MQQVNLFVLLAQLFVEIEFDHVVFDSVDNYDLVAKQKISLPVYARIIVIVICQFFFERFFLMYKLAE